MSRLTRGTSRIFVGVFGLLLVGAVAFAQHNDTLARIFTGPASAVAVASGRHIFQQVSSSRLRPTMPAALLSGFDSVAGNISYNDTSVG